MNRWRVKTIVMAVAVIAGAVISWSGHDPGFALAVVRELLTAP